MSGLTKKRILVIDDDESIREFVSLALGDEGYDVVIATNGLEAIHVIEETHPQLILLDMRMPVMDGWSFAKTYRALPIPHVPIIVLTAAKVASDFAQQVQADAFLAKPFSLDDLLNLIATYF